VTRKKRGTASAVATGAPVEGGRSESIARKAYAGVAAVVAATVARKIVEKVWVKATGKQPPDEPESPAVHWAEAVGWSALSGTSIAVARLLATRRAAGAWQRVSDDSPTLTGANGRAGH
jgi:hypothetical protein